MPKIFIVHRQGHKLRDKVAKIVESLEMTPYILEKDYMGAIIIATADEATTEWQNLTAPKISI